MKIQINEVWNSQGRSEKLVVIEAPNTRPDAARAVQDWIHEHRPDLFLATSMNAHGYHAIAISQGGK